jgi:hypothetical protein
MLFVIVAVSRILEGRKRCVRILGDSPGVARDKPQSKKYEGGEELRSHAFLIFDGG